MPIDYSKYPDNWLNEIRPKALDRDHHRCRFCGLTNYLWIFRAEDGTPYEAIMVHDEHEENGRDYFGTVLPLDVKMIKVVLTIAHLDQDITNNEHDNLAALCQRCHLNHDRPFIQERRRQAKREKQPELFEGQS